jgi:hypothetical protein
MQLVPARQGGIPRREREDLRGDGAVTVRSLEGCVQSKKPKNMNAVPHGVGEPDRQLEKAKKRCVGALDGHAVYFVGSRMGFHLAVERAPGVFRRLSEKEHLRFRLQSRVDGLDYGTP